MRKILLIKLGALGDVVRTTGLLIPLRRRYGPCLLFWLTSREALPLLRGLPIDRTGVLGAKPPSWLSEGSFDLVVGMDEEQRAAHAASAAAAVRRVGAYLDAAGRVRYTPDSELVFGMSLLASDRRRADALKRANRTSYPRLWARVLGLRGPLADFRPLLASPGRASRGVGSGVVAVHAGAGRRWPSKRLPIPVAAEIVKRLARAGLSPVLVAGPGEGRRNAAIVRLAGAGKVGPARTLAGLTRWFAGCRAVVATDSLPMHLALAAGVPCVALFGPTSAAEIETFGRAVKLVPKPPCTCFYRPVCSGDSCLGRLDPDAVVKAVLRLGARR
ncbi:MAG: glycosyltransferase family 9 protein [Elusimicrobiota bacterium]